MENLFTIVEILFILICAMAAYILLLLCNSTKYTKPIAKKGPSKLSYEILMKELTDSFDQIKNEQGEDAAFEFLEHRARLSQREIELRLKALGA